MGRGQDPQNNRKIMSLIINKLGGGARARVFLKSLKLAIFGDV